MRKNSIRRRSPPVSWNWGRPFLRYPTAKIARALPFGRDAGLIRQFGRKADLRCGVRRCLLCACGFNGLLQHTPQISLLGFDIARSFEASR